MKAVHKNIANFKIFRKYHGSPYILIVYLLLIILFPINKLKHNMTQTRFKLPLNKIKNESNTKLIKIFFSYHIFSSSNKDISLCFDSLSAFHTGISQSPQDVGHSFVGACLIKFDLPTFTLPTSL